MSHSDSDYSTVNDSANPSLAQIVEARLTRRELLKGAGAFALAGALPLASSGCATGGLRREAKLAFTPISVSTADQVRVPAGYSARVLHRWGDPIGHVAGVPEFKPDASNTAADQELQAGMHHDGMHYFSLPYGSDNSRHGLLVMNYEYTDDGLLHKDGFANWSAEKVRKSQNAHGCGVIEVRERGGRWAVVNPSKYARRVTANTPMRISGPAAGAPAMRTAFDASGDEALGTFNNCAHGVTPWGTYLACEENFDFYFVSSRSLTADHVRYGLTPKGRGHRWNEFDERFDAGRHPNEPNRFGWVVEFDPFDPQSKPIKRTALGRFNHEGACYAPAKDGRAAYYMGDDRQFEYVYKFVSRDRVNNADRNANRDVLDYGTLYVARFHENGSGEWRPLTHGQGPLSAAAGFKDQADVLIRARAAADALGATKMDRPEWIAAHPSTYEVYCALTNNSSRGAPGVAGLDSANPRVNNAFGHIVRWREERGDAAALRFEWDIFVLAGDPSHTDAGKRGNVKGDVFGNPDGLWFDDSGLLWIQTDVSPRGLNRGDYANFGNNQMLCADPRTGEIRRFLTGPNGCEVTGAIMTPDAKTMFVNMQHPGETGGERNDPAKPQAVSTWPDGPAGGRPRSATVVIRKDDDGVIGS